MKKEEYREARREFGETAAGLGKEVRKEAREAYRNVRESADTRMKEIKAKYDGLISSLQECYETVRANRAELDIPTEEESGIYNSQDDLF